LESKGKIKKSLFLLSNAGEARKEIQTCNLIQQAEKLNLNQFESKQDRILEQIFTGNHAMKKSFWKANQRVFGSL